MKQREHIIKQNNEQIIELSTRLHQEIVKHEELSELLRKKEQEDKVKSDSLSDSDEALARSLSDKERMEQILVRFLIFTVKQIQLFCCNEI